MNPLRELEARLSFIEEKICYPFEDKNLLILSFVHRSFVNEHRDLIAEHNERLEFLGDSVLGLAIADYLYHRLPSYPEGDLSQFRSRLVDAASCAQYLQKLGLADFILLGRGEKLSEGKAKISILADVFEALVGALYLDGGLTIVKSFLLCQFEPEIELVLGTPSRNYKAELQDDSQRRFQKPPLYKVMSETGPGHAKVFHVVVYVGDQEAGMGMGTSKKEAEQRAAFDALSKRREGG